MMNKLISLRSNILYIYLYLIQIDALKELPEYITPCKNDQNLSNCARRVLENLRPHLAKGIPELELPPLVLLRTAPVKDIQRNTRIASYIANFTNPIWRGAENYEVLDILIDLNKHTLRLNLNFPSLYFDTDIFLEGSVLTFNINGTGAMSISYTNAALDIVLSGETFWENGNEFILWKVENIEVKYGEVYFTRLVGFFEDPTYTELFRISVNKAARLLAASIRVPLEGSIVRFIVNVIVDIHRTFPKDFIYPEPHIQ